MTNALALIRSLGPIDVKSIHRDPMLRWMVALPLVLTLAVRWILPLIVGELDSRLPLDLQAVYPALMGYMFLLLIPYMTGAVIGFLLLDQRDDRTLTALQVTPLSLNGYLVYRLAMPMILSVLLTLIVFPLGNVVAVEPRIVLLLALAAMPQAPLFALAMGVLSDNKVQGFAVMKTSGVVLMPPAVAYFIQGTWQWLFGIVPTYWPARLLWAAQGNEPVHVLLLVFVVGLLYQGLILLVLVRRFNRVMTR